MCAVRQALDHRKLQRESTERLNGFMEELRSEASANLSAKNLGNEGTAYVADALAYNDRWVPVTEACTTHPSGVK